MQDKINVSIVFPFKTAYAATLQLILRSPLQMAFSLAFPVAGIYLVFLWTKSHHSYNLTDFGLLILCFFFTPITTAFSLYLARRRNPLCIGPFLYSFNDEGIHLSGEAFAMTIKWSAIQKVTESKTFMFFFTAPGRAHTLPIDQLRSSGCLESIRTFVYSKMSQKIK